MKKLLYFLLSASLCAMVGCSKDDDNTPTPDPTPTPTPTPTPSSEQISIKLIDNKFDGGENAQGFAAFTLSESAPKGYNFTITVNGTTDAPDGNVSVCIVDTVADDFGEPGWNVINNDYQQRLVVKEGKVSGTVSYKLSSTVVKPCLCLFVVDDFEKYFDKTFDIELSYTCVDPNYRDPGVTIDETTITLDGIAFNWGASSYDAATKTITFNEDWTGEGWAWWGTGLDVTDYKSITLEFEETDCQVQLWAQQLTDGTIDEADLAQGKAVAEIRDTSVTLDFNEMYEPFDKDKIGQIMIMRATAGTLVLKKVYLTYEDKK